MIRYLADQDFKDDTLKWAKKRGLQVMHYRYVALETMYVLALYSELCPLLLATELKVTKSRCKKPREPGWLRLWSRFSVSDNRNIAKRVYPLS